MPWGKSRPPPDFVPDRAQTLEDAIRFAIYTLGLENALLNEPGIERVMSHLSAALRNARS